MPAYRDFYYPLNVFMHVLTLEGADPAYLHYGLFEREDESLGEAQERSTAMLLARLPSPPASVLDVGIGLATTLARLTAQGYDAEGITPDAKQIAMAQGRFGERIRLTCARFEEFDPGRRFDVVIFQESSQYIDSDALFARANELTSHVVVLDEFAAHPLDHVGSLRDLGGFVAAARRNGFAVVEDVELSSLAAPTVDYFTPRIPKYREQLIADLGVTDEQMDDLISSGRRYRELYRDGAYVYRLLDLRRVSL